MADVQRIIDRIMSGSRIQASSHFSHRVYSDEPILTTGRQMANYLPDKYREMRAISRWQEDPQGGRGRWLSEAELFYRQGKFMEDFEDDCPYRGTFKSYYPTYNAMSDRQLRGYFTWRTQVRAGDVRETSLSFAYVYLYELINGIGVTTPQEGYAKLFAFWQAYRQFAPEIDRNARVWLQDYVVYHGLDASLVQEQDSMQLTRKIVELGQVTEEALAWSEAHGGKRRGKVSRMPLPANAELEDRLVAAIDALATHRIASSRFYQEEPAGLRHVACAVYLRMCDHFARQHEGGLIECFFGSVATLSYAMFAAAIFFEPERHADATYTLNDLRTFTCKNGLWTYTGLHGNGSGGKRLGLITRSTDRIMRETYGFAHPLQERDVPKYLVKHIEREIEMWRAWESEHAPVKIDIDLSKLAGIRSVAAVTREALLTDEERGDAPAAPSTHDSCEALPADSHEAPCESNASGGAATPSETEATGACEAPETPKPSSVAANEKASAATGSAGTPDATGFHAPSAIASVPNMAGLLAPEQATFLRALLAGDRTGAQNALAEALVSEDLLVDAINEALFDALGDTTIEFGPEGPAIVEEYREDIEGMLAHA